MKLIYGYRLSNRRNRLTLLIGFTVFILLMSTFNTSLSANESERNLLERARITQYSKQQKQQIINNKNMSNASIIQQIGNDNNASVMQSQSTSYQAGNFAFIHQHGNQNNAGIFQQGDNHTAVIWQEGNGHNATINQKRVDRAFTADIRQFGTASNLEVTQSGSDWRSINIEHHAYSGSVKPITIETH